MSASVTRGSEPWDYAGAVRGMRTVEACHVAVAAEVVEQPGPALVRAAANAVRAHDLAQATLRQDFLRFR